MKKVISKGIFFLALGFIFVSMIQIALGRDLGDMPKNIKSENWISINKTVGIMLGENEYITDEGLEIAGKLMVKYKGRWYRLLLEEPQSLIQPLERN